MKKIYTTLLAVSALYAGQAQVRNNFTPIDKSINGTTAFLDASSSVSWNNTNNVGKGLVFPRTNLVNLTTLLAPVQGLPFSFPNRLDGMIVYNTESGTAAIGGTSVKRGFYYYKNDSNDLQGGTWVPLGSSEAGLWKENKKVENGFTSREVILPILDSEGEKRTGLYASFEAASKATQADFVASGYGIGIRRFSNDINPTTLSFAKYRGTIDTPQPLQAGDVIGQILYAIGDPSETSKNTGAGFIRHNLLEYENPNSFSTGFTWGVRKKSLNRPYLAMFLDQNGALGVGKQPTDSKLTVLGIGEGINNVVDFKTYPGEISAFRVGNDGITYTRSLISEGNGAVGTSISIQNNSKTLNTQINRWAWFNAYDTHPTSQTQGYREGLVLWAYNKEGVSPSGSKVIIADNGNVGIGGAFIYKANNMPVDEKLVVDGNIKSMRLKGVGERVVVADENGVLKIGNTSSFSSKWVEDTSTNSLTLAVTSTGAPRVSTPEEANRNNVTIDDEGKILARGFVGYNGASVFPDYVFEKYYDGKSVIKADYNFHNLNQVEDFIKKNGHLPGYTSAKEIAEKGLIDLGATQLTNIEKIEELYLHTIEQDKAIKAKDAKIAELEARLERIEKQLSK